MRYRWFLAMTVTVCCTILLATNHAPAQEISAEDIIKRVDDVRNPQMDYTVRVQVASYSASGKVKKATYDVLVKGTDKTLIKTIEPALERGRILLMNGHNLWAFFPDVSKPIRLSLQERLIGDVSNGDIARANFSGDYDAVLLRTDTIDEKDYYVLELTANSPEVTYARAILWAAKENFWPLKSEFYAVSGKLIKTCSYEQYIMLADALRPSQLVMNDPILKGKRSLITYENITVEELPDKYFTKDYMKKLME